MKDSITVTYLKKSYIWDISAEDKFQNAVNKITKLIMRKIRPIYGVLLVQFYDVQNVAISEIYKYADEKMFAYIKENVQEYIKCNEAIDVEGFILFRLKRLWDVINDAISDFFKKDYLILTDLFNDYINSARAIYETIYVIATDKSYSVYDDNKEMIAYIKKYDDTLLDILINIAPKKLFIYNADKFSGNTLLENIKAIFKDKAVFDRV